MMWIVILALRRPYTFVCMSLLILILGAFARQAHELQISARRQPLADLQAARAVFTVDEYFGPGHVVLQFLAVFACDWSMPNKKAAQHAAREWASER